MSGAGRGRRSWGGGLALCWALLCAAGPVAGAETVYVVVSALSPVRSVTPKEVLALYTGRSRALASGAPCAALDQQRDGATRADFYQALTGMDIARINSYWARLHFTGQVQPPPAVGNDADVVERLRADPAAIAYLSHEPHTDAVRVVLRLP